MSKAVQKQCLICGRTFEVKVLDDVSRNGKKDPRGRALHSALSVKQKLRKRPGMLKKNPGPCK